MNKTQSKARIPVILDTDIGGDIDDTWALVMLLKSPELDVKLITTDQGNTEYRARIVAKLLEVAGRTDIPVGIGLKQGEGAGPQAEWVEDYDLKEYPGTVLTDGVGAICETIRRSATPLTLISIGPVPNIAAALRRDPLMAARALFVGMHGSFRKNYEGKPGAIAEWNVVADAAACRAAFAAPWQRATITPLDTCGDVRLTGDRYRRVREAVSDPLIRALMENYRIWRRNARPDWNSLSRIEIESSILYDTVAVYLALTTEHLAMERMGVRVTEDGFTVPDPSGRPLDVAMEWTDKEAYLDFLTDRLLGEVVR